jgi:hypothetical protein
VTPARLEELAPVLAEVVGLVPGKIGDALSDLIADHRVPLHRQSANVPSTGATIRRTIGGFQWASEPIGALIMMPAQ